MECKTFSSLQFFEFYKPVLSHKLQKQLFDDGTFISVDTNSFDFMLTFLEDLDEPIKEKILSVKEMSDLTLLELYRTNNFETILFARYMNIQNELVRRGLKDNKIVDLNNATLKEKVVQSYSFSLEDSQNEIFNRMKRITND